MKLTSLITRTATIALAIAALAAPTASARPADLPAALASAAEQQRQDAGSAEPAAYPTRPAQGEQANPRPEIPAAGGLAPAERDIAWTTIAIGIAGSLLAIAGIGAIASRARRTGRPRISA